MPAKLIARNSSVFFTIRRAGLCAFINCSSNSGSANVASCLRRARADSAIKTTRHSCAAAASQSQWGDARWRVEKSMLRNAAESSVHQTYLQAHQRHANKQRPAKERRVSAMMPKLHVRLLEPVDVIVDALE